MSAFGRYNLVLKLPKHSTSAVGRTLIMNYLILSNAAVLNLCSFSDGLM
jgi:hypothetical protein